MKQHQDKDVHKHPQQEPGKPQMPAKDDDQKNPSQQSPDKKDIPDEIPEREIKRTPANPQDLPQGDQDKPQGK